MVDQNILQDHAFLGKTAFECRGKTTLISKDEDDIATPCLRFGQDRRLSTADGHQLAHRFATTGLPDSDSPLLADSGLSAQAYSNIVAKETRFSLVVRWLPCRAVERRAPTSATRGRSGRSTCWGSTLLRGAPREEGLGLTEIGHRFDALVCLDTVLSRAREFPSRIA